MATMKPYPIRNQPCAAFISYGELENDMSNKAQAVRAQIEAALAGRPTAGPWRHNKDNEQIGDVTLEDGSRGLATATRASAGVFGWQQRDKDAAYIAACNPANIRILLDDHDAKLRAAEGRVAALTEALSSIILAADSKEAQGGARWFAEAVSGPIEDARAALATNQATLPSGASQ